MLLTLVVGSLLAPSAHYAFMLFSDLYGLNDVEGHHDHGMSQQPATAYIGVSGVQAHDGDNKSIECDYADLFATFAASSPPLIAALPAPPLKQVLLGSVIEAPVSQQFLPFHQRGPPISA